MSSEKLSDGVLFGMGNPLLDIQAVVTKEFLKKWDLKEDNAILCDEKYIPMFHEMAEKFDVEYIPGGATQNVMRVCSWILGSKPNLITFSGSIGKDHFGQILEKKVREVGVNPIYQKHENEKTGTCASCITGINRSLCAHLAAANCFTKDHLDIAENKALMEKAKFFYIAGFFLTVCPDAMLTVANHALEQNKHFMLNLSAPFLISVFKEPMMKVFPYVDIIFGNETEAKEFGKEHNFETEDVVEIAKKMSKLPKNNSSRPRIAIITQGSLSTVVAQGDSVQEFPVAKLKPEQLVDTNGAGDAFVGGFLAQLIQGKAMEECIRCGHWAASVIIQRSGCTFPPQCSYA